ncbi:MAG: phospholipase D-like domain-containing protein [Thermomicrobia bacterium]|nr:phospholipase D-like domain-containing protein [Thermomicrobia bacterium]
MRPLTTLESIAGRQIRRAFGPLHRHFQPHHEPRYTAGEETPLRKPDAWWADDPRWYPADTPPRRHNRATPLVDGENFFAALQEALAQAMEYVYIAGWSLTPHIPLARHQPGALIETQLLDLLTEAAQRVPVRILLWSGAPALLQPTTRTVKDVRQMVLRETRGDLRCELDTSARISHCHHQKAIVVDGRIAFVGGMDLTTFQGDRWDRTNHPLRAGPNWHDMQVRIEGEAVADVEQNFCQRWAATTGETDLPHRDAVCDPAWQTAVQIVRTIPEKIYSFAPEGEFGIFHAYLRAIRQAERLIYLENQYLWSDEIMEALIEVMNRQRSDPFRIVIVLPARAYSGAWDNDKHVSKLREVDNGRGIVSVYCPYTSGPSSGVHAFTYRPVYVHAKVAIIDDAWLTIGSANLNERGFFTDSEINAVIADATIARNLRIDLWAEHLALPREEVERADPVALVDHAWVDRAAENARIIARGTDPLRSPACRYEAGRKPGAWFLEEAEALTFEH